MTGRAPDTLIRSDDWHDHAACAGDNDSLWFNDRNARAAKLRCSGCPVRRQCLTEIMAWETGRSDDHRWGVYGGYTADERKAMSQPAARPERNVGGRPHAPCGSDSAYNRHVRNAEPIDEPCRRAHREAAALFRATGSRTVAA